MNSDESTGQEGLLYEKRPDGVAVITFNRPERMNAISSSVRRLLPKHIAAAAQDEEVRCVVLTGNGRAFCAGADVKRLAESATPERDDGGGRNLATEVRQLREYQMRTIHLLHTMAKPTVAAVNGFAIGAGLSYALACDLRIASDAAEFAVGFGRIALSGDTGASWFLQRLVGPAKAYELFLTGEVLGAARALDLGIVNRVEPAETFPGAVADYASALAAGPPLAFARMKEGLHLGERSDLKTLLDHEALSTHLSLRTEDHREAINALASGATPTFVGR